MITDLGRWFQWKDFLFAQVIPNTVVLQREISNRLMQLHLKLHYDLENNRIVLSLLPGSLLHIFCAALRSSW